MKKLKFATWLLIVSVALFFIASIVAMCTSEDAAIHGYCIAVMTCVLVFATPLWMWGMFATEYPDEFYRINPTSSDQASDCKVTIQ